MELGSRISILLNERNLSRSQFARILGINYNTVSGYLQNRRMPDCHTLLRIANTLDTSTDYLLGLTEVRYHQGSSHSEKETHLLRNYRCLNSDMRNVLFDISLCLYKSQRKDNFL